MQFQTDDWFPGAWNCEIKDVFCLLLFPHKARCLVCYELSLYFSSIAVWALSCGQFCRVSSNYADLIATLCGFRVFAKVRTSSLYNGLLLPHCLPFETSNSRYPQQCDNFGLQLRRVLGCQLEHQSQRNMNVLHWKYALLNLLCVGLRLLYSTDNNTVGGCACSLETRSLHELAFGNHGPIGIHGRGKTKCSCLSSCRDLSMVTSCHISNAICSKIRDGLCHIEEKCYSSVIESNLHNWICRWSSYRLHTTPKNRVQF